MKGKVIILKGNNDLIQSTRYKMKSRVLYKGLENIFKDMGYKVFVMETNYGGTLDKALKGYDIVVGHSRGASRIAEWFSEELFPDVKGIFLLDPKDVYLSSNTHWNKLRLPKSIIASLYRDENDPDDDYRGFDSVYEIKDDHYFNNSLDKLESIIRNILS